MAGGRDWDPTLLLSPICRCITYASIIEGLNIVYTHHAASAIGGEILGDEGMSKSSPGGDSLFGISMQQSLDKRLGLVRELVPGVRRHFHLGLDCATNNLVVIVAIEWQLFKTKQVTVCTVNCIYITLPQRTKNMITPTLHRSAS